MGLVVCDRCGLSCADDCGLANCPNCDGALVGIVSSECPHVAGGADRPRIEKAAVETLGSDPVLIVWEPRFCVGVPEIDAQHEEICRIINDLYAAVKTRKRREGFFLEVMARLQMYIRQHFSAEESLFLDSAYSEHQSHIERSRFAAA